MVVGIRTRQEVRAQALGMVRHVACLRGWHPALARAEIAALLPHMETNLLRARRLVEMVGETSIQVMQEAVEISSGCQAILCNALVWDWDQNQSLDELVSRVAKHITQHQRKGSIAVRAWRHEGRIEGLGPSRLAQKIGGQFHDLGYTIDLNEPEHRFGVVLDASSNTVACGWMIGFGDESDGLASRKAAERPFFKPVSLDPRLARLAVNLASGPVGRGTTLDVMTGTGGFLIESVLSGRASIGLDLEQVMVDGTRENLDWAVSGSGLVAHQGVVLLGDATALEEHLPTAMLPITGFVLDPPYGRNSQGSLGPISLLERVLESSTRVAASNAGLVLILPIHPMGEHPDAPLKQTDSIDLLHGTWKETERALSIAGWSIQAKWVEHVHASLSRLILHATIAPQD